MVLPGGSDITTGSAAGTLLTVGAAGHVTQQRGGGGGARGWKQGGRGKEAPPTGSDSFLFVSSVNFLSFLCAIKRGGRGEGRGRGLSGRGRPSSFLHATGSSALRAKLFVSLYQKT